MRALNQGRHIPILLTFVAFLAVSLQQRDSQIFAQEAAGTQARSDTGTIVAGMFQLRYRIEGTGAPTIVIGSAIYHPRVFSQNLRQHLRLVFLDHWGFAPSPGRVDTTEFALDAIVDDIERARKELGLGRVAIALKGARICQKVSSQCIAGDDDRYGAEPERGICRGQQPVLGRIGISGTQGRHEGEPAASSRREDTLITSGRAIRQMVHPRRSAPLV